MLTATETEVVLPAHLQALALDKAGLPSPPTDEQKFWYYGAQKIWIFFALGFTLVTAYSLARFSLSNITLLWPFAVLLVLVVGVAALQMFTSSSKRRTDLPEHLAMVAAYSPEVYPSVDVFLPSAGEDLRILANTFEHVARLDWAGELTVRVLDDSARDDVRILAEHHGFVYHTRPNRGELKKAGNLKYGYERSSSDFIVVFDADFVPRPDFINELLPYFENREVGIVQSPQFFGTTKEMNWLERAAGSVQELFYRWVQPSRDAHGAAICVGTNAIYRRAALEAGGGFAQIGHSEDVHTGVNMLKKGYRARYVPVNMAKGLCPDNLSGFINQQYRWCAGSMSLLRQREFHKAPLGFRQRLCFWSGFAYYISTALFVFTAPLPTILMVWFFPHAVSVLNYTVVGPAVLVSLFVAPRIFKSQWGPTTMRVQLVYSYAHALAVWHTLRGHTAEWVPTGAAGKGTPLAVTVQRIMTSYILVSLGALWAGLAYHMAQGETLRYLPTMLFVSLASYIGLPIILPIKTKAEKRAERELRALEREMRREVKQNAATAALPVQRASSVNVGANNSGPAA